MADYVKMIEDLADEFGGTMRYDYSGRAMYGKRCVGIDVPMLDDIIERLNEMEVDELMGYATDNMGLGYIIYWPKINPEQVVEEDIVENEVVEEEPVAEEAQESEVEEPVVEDKPKMTDKQLSVHYTITSNELITFTAAELAEVSEYTPRQLAGILSGLSKKGIIKKDEQLKDGKTAWKLA